MIISKIQGGLGNQLFQWSFGRCLSLKNNTDLYLDTSLYSTQFGITKREFLLSRLPLIECNFFINKTSDLKSINEESDISNLDPNLNYYLNGYWQSEKYFMEHENIIRNEIFQNKVSDNNNLSLHIRRTDYLTTNGYHPVQPIEYYEKAIDVIGNYDKLLVFSDDIEWCKNNLKFDNMIFVEGNSEIEDLKLMSNCRNNIIANSSFSWWGAWLNSNKDKIVVAPKKWFGDHVMLDTSELIPKNWISI